MADRTRKREQQPLQLPQQNKRQKRQGELTSESQSVHSQHQTMATTNTESPRGNGGGLRVDALLSPAPVSKGGEDRCEPGSLGPSPRVTPLCKKPISSFALFANAIRPRLKREYPQMPLAEIARETGRQWKALSVDEQAKWNTASKN